MWKNNRNLVWVLGSAGLLGECHSHGLKDLLIDFLICVDPRVDGGVRGLSHHLQDILKVISNLPVPLCRILDGVESLKGKDVV